MGRTLLDRFGWAVAGALAIALIGALAGVVRGGPLDPPGPPASTLPLVEPRMPIRQPASAAGFPIVISMPGSYYLADNITGVAGKAGIWIQADAVTLDLNGFALTGVPGSGDGIVAPSVHRNLSVRNGTVCFWSGGGIYGDNVKDSTYEDLRLCNNTVGGIRTSGNSLISRVVATGNSAHGILMHNLAGEGGIIRDSTASDNVQDGIQVLGRTLVVNNTSLRNGGSAIHVIGSGNRIDSNNVEILAPAGLAINVVSAGNLIVRNSVHGAFFDSAIAPGNTVGPFETATTPFSHPWANIVY